VILPGGTPEQDIQVGIVSWGENCADPIFPGVASRVNAGYDWIQRWVCAIDGEDAPEWFACTADATYSPAPSVSPKPPSVSPAPTIAMVDVTINIHMYVGKQPYL
jgi:hypothetical protein